MSETQSRWKRFKEKFVEAFVYEDDENWEPNESQQEIVLKLAKWVIRRRLTLPAIMSLESMMPLNFIGSQAMVFFQPFVAAFLDTKGYEEFQSMLENRQSISYMISVLETHEEAYIARQKAHKKAAAQEDKECLDEQKT